MFFFSHRITSSRYSKDCSPCFRRNTVERTFKSLHVRLWSRYVTAGLAQPQKQPAGFSNTTATSKTAETNLSGEMIDNVCRLSLSEHFSRLSFRLIYCCLWISNVPVWSGNAGEHPLDSNGMLQVRPWTGEVHLSCKLEQERWTGGEIKIYEKRTKQKSCTRPKILRQRLGQLQLLRGSGIHLDVCNTLGSGGCCVW